MELLLMEYGVDVIVCIIINCVLVLVYVSGRGFLFFLFIDLFISFLLVWG